MRITGGAARGIPLKVPKGDAVRPATDALRQAVFSSLAPRIAGARFADLFAGSGAYGLEALSRGAASGLFFERNAHAAACLRENLAAVRRSLGSARPEFAPPTAEASGTADTILIEADALTAPFPGPAADLIFVDPPYEDLNRLADRIFHRALELALPVSADPLLIFEMPGDIDLHSDAWQLVKRLGKGIRQPTAAVYRRNTRAV